MFLNAAQSHKVVQEEIFGPVLAVQSFRTIDEVIQNHSDEAILENIAEKVNEMMSHRPIFTW